MKGAPRFFVLDLPRAVAKVSAPHYCIVSSWRMGSDLNFSCSSAAVRRPAGQAAQAAGPLQEDGRKFG